MTVLWLDSEVSEEEVKDDAKVGGACWWLSHDRAGLLAESDLVTRRDEELRFLVK